MVIRIKKKLYLKPRKCPVCNRMRLFARHPLARCCKKCHVRQRRISRMAERKRQRKTGVYKYNSHYKSIRKKALKEHPYCSLCGSEIRLTVHHVGGGCEHYTVLCDDCHQAYERWNNKRKATICKKKILIGGLNLWKNTMRTARFRCLMYCYRIRLRLALEPPEARLAFVSSVSGNTTN